MLFSVSYLNAQTTLSAGDLAVIGVNCDTPDDFAFLLLVDIDAGTLIKFTDKGWLSAGGFRALEGIQTYTSPSALTAGAVVIFSTSSGDFSSSGSFALSADGDQLLVYQGDEASPTFINAINIEGDHVWQADAIDAQTSALPTGLTNGTNAVALDEYDNVMYNGSTSFSSPALALDAICDYTNWIGHNTSTYDFTTFGDFTLPVTLSTFTAQYLNNIPTLYWVTQSETDNIGWYVYRNMQNDFITSIIISDLIPGYGTTTEPHSYIYEDYIENVLSGYIYWYWLESIDFGGTFNHYDKVAHIVIPDNNDPGNSNPEEPEEFGLFQNNPNPFNPKTEKTTKVSFNLKENSEVQINIFNIKGELVKTVYNNFATADDAVWDGKDEKGNIQATGIYFYELKVNNKVHSTKRIILIR